MYNRLTTMKRPRLLFALIIVTLPLLRSQQPKGPEFEVVSVKPGDPSTHGQMVRRPPGRYEAHNLTLLSLVLGAYNINATQLIGGPNWLTSVGWDIEGTFPAASTDEQTRQMMQSMLADRFGLVAHRETRSLPIYSLVVSKQGSKLKKATDPTGGMSAGPRMIRYSSVSMTELAGQLSSYLERQVIDDTGLTGLYVIDLRFAPVETSASSGAAESGPTLFTALQEQAGLQLVSTRGPVEVLVIDKAEKPSAN